MRSPILATLTVAVVLAGCVKYHPRPLDPARIAQQFNARTLDDAGLRGFLKRTDWPPARLGLNDLAAVALYFSPELDVARAQFRAARASVLAAKARPNPSLTAGGGWTNSPESPLVFHFDPALTLETAGKRAWRILAAQKRAESARVAVAETAWHIRSRVRSAWLDYLMAIRSFEVMRNEHSVRAADVAILEKRMSVGEVSTPDVNVARAALITVAVAMKAAESQVHQSAAALASVIGLPMLPDLDMQETPLPGATIRLADIQESGLLHRADIRRSLLEYAAAEANLHLEIANQYPDLQLNPGYGFDEGHHKITFGPALPLPLFNRNRGPIAEAEARRAEAEARFNAIQAQAIGEMQIAMARYEGARAELADAEQRLIRIQQVRERAVLRAVRVGEEDQLTVARVRLEAAVSARARLDAMMRVQSALGALEDAVQQPLEPGPPLPDSQTKP